VRFPQKSGRRGFRPGLNGSVIARRRAALRWLLLAIGLLLPLSGLAATVKVARIDGAISPASSAYFQRALQTTQQSGAQLLVLKLDTPGGLDSAMREMIQSILASPAPVAIWVAPAGSRAASAGTYLLYASHIAAMMPGTNLGAATPVAIGIGGPPGKPAGNKPPGNNPKNDQGAAPSASAMEKKAVQDAAAYIRGLAQLRGRNVEWAERAVREAESLSAAEAVKLKVVDFIAVDLADLLRQADGRRIKLDGGEITLALADANIEVIEPNWREQLLMAIANPNVALILMMLGIYGLLFEFYTPGFGVAGIIGAICLLFGSYALAMLPINAVGALLLLLGIALMAMEAFMPSFGAFGIGGSVAFIAGALMLIDADIPGLEISLALIVPLAVLSALALAGIGAFALRARRRPTVSGVEAMLGATVEALEDFEHEGWVRASGERWQASSATPMRRGAHARITAVRGLTLVVQPETKEEQP
jgi:membrane-bound serine protease (ClpP class)